MNRVICRRYHIFLQLGGLADSSTWLAVDTGDVRAQLVVLQQIPAQAEMLQLVTEQVRRAARVASPQATQILGLEREGQEYFVIRDFVYGESLGHILTRLAMQGGSYLPIPLALRIVAEIARILHGAHSLTDERGYPANLVHGDVRLSNIVLSLDGRVRLLDLGISAALNQRRQQSKGRTGAQMGYLAPEQCMGSWGDSRSDIFALGVVLWEMLTGRRLYENSSTFDVIRAICDEPTDPPSVYNTAIPPFLDSLVHKALAKEPDERFGDAGQLASSLERLLGTLSRGESPPLVPFLEQLFPNRMPRWSHLARLVDERHFDDAVRLAQSLIGPAAQDPGEQTAVRPAELERLRTQTIQYSGVDDVTSPALTSPSQTQTWAKKAEDEDETAVTITRASLHSPPPEDIRATEEMDDVTLLDDLKGATQEVTAPRDQLYSDPAPITPQVEQPSQTEGQYVDLGELFDALEDVAPPAQEEAREKSAESSSPVDASAPKLVPEALEVPEVIVTPEPTPEPVRGLEVEGQDIAGFAPRIDGELHADVPRFDDGSIPVGSFLFTHLDEDEMEPPFVEPFSMEEVVVPDQAPKVLREDQHDPMPVVEILRAREGRILDSEILRGLRRTFRPPQKRFTIKLAGKKANIEFAESAQGWVRRKGDGSLRESLDGVTGTVTLSLGEAAVIHDQGLTYYVRIFYPPNAPVQERRQLTGKKAVGFGLVFALAIVLHAVGIAAAITVSTQLGLRLVVEEPPQAEIFAEGELAVPEPPTPPEPEPPKPPEPPAPRRVEPRPADPAEQVVQIPKAVREQLDRRRRETRSTDTASSADNLLNTLASPVAGEGETIKDVVSNIDAVAANSGSAAFRVGGTLAGLEGDEVNVASGGGGKLGNLTGGQAPKGAGKLDKRADSGKVRGRVRATQALSRQQGEGSLSPGEVTAVINRHLGQIQGCYEAGLLRNSSLAGQIAFEWTVNNSGNVTGAREVSSTVGDPQVSNCILGVIRRMKFPSPSGGDSVTIRYPFMFSSSS